MEWAEFVKSLVQFLSGASIALAAIWAKEYFDRRRALHTWYEEQYIRGGIDQLIAYFMTLHYSLMGVRLPIAIPEAMLTLPVESINKIQIALQTEAFTTAPIMIYDAVIAARSYTKDLGHLEATIEALEEKIKVADEAIISNPTEMEQEYMEERGKLLEKRQHFREQHERFKSGLNARENAFITLSTRLRYALEKIREEMLSADIRRKTDIYLIAGRPVIKAQLEKVSSAIDNCHADVTRLFAEYSLVSPVDGFDSLGNIRTLNPSKVEITTCEKIE